MDPLPNSAPLATELRNTLIQYHNIGDSEWRLAKKTKDATVWRKPSEEFSGYLYKAQGVVEDVTNRIVDHIRPGPYRLDWDSLMTTMDIMETFEEKLQPLPLAEGRPHCEAGHSAGSQNSSPKGQDLLKKDGFEVDYRRPGSFPLVSVDIQHYFRTQMVDIWLEHGFSFAVALKEDLYGKNCCVMRYTTAGQLWNIIAPREFVDFSYTTSYEDGLLTCGISLDYGEVRPNFVRGFNHPCGWFCVPLKDYPSHSLLTGYIQTELRGMLPQSAVDTAMSSTLANFFSDLKKALKT